MTRDIYKAGHNWYSYCGNDPVDRADPNGFVKIIVVWYQVFGPGYHSGILIVDNMKQGSPVVYSFAGGPKRYGVGNNGKLISRSGSWSSNPQDRRGLGGNCDGHSGIVLVDDDSAAQPWIDRFNEIEREMKAENEAQYSPVPAPWGNTANSNSWCRELVERAGLLDEYDHAVKKRGTTPWTPGWGKDVWGGRRKL